jgi:CIC family chloride channel protein
MEELREESNLHLEDAMQPVIVPILQGSETIADMLRSLAQYKDLKSIPVFLVHCPDGLWYSARREELEALSQQKSSEGKDTLTPISSAATLAEHLGPERTPVIFPDLPLASALPHFQRWPLLPITNRAIRGSLEGTVTLQDVLNRYQKH